MMSVLSYLKLSFVVDMNLELLQELPRRLQFVIELSAPQDLLCWNSFIYSGANKQIIHHHGKPDRFGTKIQN